MNALFGIFPPSLRWIH